MEVLLPIQDGAIFMVDSFDEERMDEAKQELHHLVHEEGLKGKPFLVFANKLDRKRIHFGDLAIRLGLDGIEDSPWQIRGMSNSTGEGINEGLEWLCQVLKYSS